VTTGNKKASAAERLFVELQELSECRRALCSEVDLPEDPDMEEDDAGETLHEELF